ncbi:bifunctional glycoside hydrolase 114/ polysaccharide deacetylase family protein [Paracidovorax sp. MALMAid1276]|uniref:bifunctional glycoside hydrolase 114/ polysaccharide deacetylase family protein n=1 Tax=Paracidovorax sp. MALMAid1276 TaxID=3411631 RepID=UPI003B9D4BFF
MAALRFFTALLIAMLLHGTAIARQAQGPAIALHYGSAAPLNELRVFDIVVVEPDHGHDPRLQRTQATELYAYVSVAEVQASRPYFTRIPTPWKLARNGTWNSEVIDQTPAEWPDFFAREVVEPLWQRGYRGFFLDTLDSYRLAEKYDEAAQQAGLVRVVEALHARFPGIQLILNRGFEIVPRVKDKIRMVAAESLFRGWNAQARRYEEVLPADRDWLVGQLRTIRDRDGIAVLAIDYVPPHDRALTRQTAADIAALGFTPWVSDANLETNGIGLIEPVPRRVLVVYNGAETPSINYSLAHRFLQMPLNYLGYVVDFADIRDGAPPNVGADRYAGVVTWFTGYVPENRAAALARWLQARLQERMPLLVLGDFGFAPTPALSEKLGIALARPRGPQRIVRHSPLLGFEAQPEPLNGPRFTWTGNTPPEPLIELQDDRGDRLLGGALTGWGGFLSSPFVTSEVPGTEFSHWVADPFTLLVKALRLPPMPVPDTTTENGRRLLFAHIDGDGFASRAELPGSPLAADAMRVEIIEKYRIPHAVSVIEAETAPHGLYPALSPQLEDIARKLFALPHVELASHTYSHPFLWDTSVRHGVFGDKTEAAESLSLPGYTMDLRREIVGSSDYINQRLAPPGKQVKILLWSGDTAPNAEALEITERAGLLNMNGGDTSISHNVPTLTEVGPLGITKNGFLQVYAPITNENIYTNLWKGPFYGYQRVLQTFEMTESPRRLKPVDIYYHTYSASKRAGLAALHKAYRWAQEQPLHPVFPSEYIRKVRDWHNMALARDGAGWRIRGAGDLRTLRLPADLGTPDLLASTGVAGWHDAPQGRYVHLAGGSAQLRTTGAPAAVPALHDANARLESWTPRANGTGVDFALRGYAPLEFSLLHAENCQVRSEGRALTAQTSSRRTAPAARAYRLPHATADIQIACPAR